MADPLIQKIWILTDPVTDQRKPFREVRLSPLFSLTGCKWEERLESSESKDG